MKLPELTMVPKVVDNPQTGGSADVMAHLVLSLVDGRSTILDISENCGLEPDLAQRIVLNLCKNGLSAIPGFEPEPEPDPTDKTETATAKKSALEIDIDEIYENLKTANLYELLGVDPDVLRKDLRLKYFDLSKRFHPDKAFGKNIEGLRQKMEIIFRHLTAAYDKLSNSTSRAEYDQSIPGFIETRLIEKKLKSAIEKSDSSPPKAKSSTPSVQAGSSKKKPKRSDHEARRLKWKRERADKAMESIYRRYSTGPPPKFQVKQRLEDAKIAIEHERFGDATRLLYEILSADPGHSEAKEMLKAAEEGNMWTIAQGHLRKGRFQQREGNLKLARKHFEQALSIDSDNIDARHLLAEALVKERKDLPRALTLANEVIDMGGQRARYFATLGEILIMAKDYGKAEQAFEKAILMEPDNKEYKKRLKVCKK
ncbi:MAG: tetratricopeptide repeat protein [Proteobacteria bacterium]|nr:tetratricopeptide repeat protein [Pseudomonadota bacterium]